MCNSSRQELLGSLRRRAQDFYITRPWGMDIEPVTLSYLFDLAGKPNNLEAVDVETVSINSEVELIDLQENQPCTLVVVAPQESVPVEGRVSFLSSLGAALMGRKPGDTVTVKVFGSILRYQIAAIR
ncbi:MULTISPECIES: GreA/GreB family elongation factor [unclassified Marinimicrobium]|jgi:hypothetical protein|uniref:GreA/GreB family elongation factor n=1 Tax=Marinimicrobium TaxID=359337 RepID=UPI000C543C2C|nr:MULTISPECIES: GreA/GreB family elongation factor [unclassified Marinimicrobium]MAN53061.1 hypothetical protein [Marinimicrobium sp.]|tara:strand:+ start:184 stop:564 length:381 start_codon:yes stop_codon:yes gene_type:complete